MQRFKWIALAVTATVLLLPGSGLAQGGAAGDQYQEQVPTAGNNSNGGDNSSGGGSGGGGTSSSGGGGGSSSSTGGSSSGGGTATPTGTATPSGTSSVGGTLDPKTQRKLNNNKDGDGSGAADYAQGSAPNSKALRKAAREAQSGTADSSTGVFGSAVGDNGSGGGVGLLVLLLVLGATALAGAGYWAWQRRQPAAAPGTAGPDRKRFRGLTLSRFRKQGPRPGRDDQVGRA